MYNIETHPDIVKNKYYYLYLKLVNSSDPIDIYKEKHHVLPKCMGGTNGVISDFSARKHFICHYLLTKFTIGSSKIKMIYSFNMMGVISGDHKQRYINSRLYLSNKKAYSEVCSLNFQGRIYVHNDSETIAVHPDAVSLYLSDGYMLGNGKAGEYKIVTNIAGERKYLYSGEELPTGYIFGFRTSTNEGKRRITDGTRDVFIEIGTVIPKKWKIGSCHSSSAGKKAINKEGKIKYISPEEVGTYLDLGWVSGTGTTHRQKFIWVNNGVEEFNIKKTEIDDYIRYGYSKGRCTNKNTIAITDGFEIKFIKKESIIPIGWRIGRI